MNPTCAYETPPVAVRTRHGEGDNDEEGDNNDKGDNDNKGDNKNKDCW